MASVSIIGLNDMVRSVGGLWSVAAILVAAAICLWIAAAFTRLSTVIPSGASMVAFAIRGLGRRLGLFLILPYFMAMILLAGFEAIVVAELATYVLPLPLWLGAGLFLVGTWAICRSGMHLGYSTQIVATSALFLLLVAISIIQLGRAAELGVLGERIYSETPSAMSFLAAIGQALFLFMGFELVTAHVEVAQSGAVRPALRYSIFVLVLFYVPLALGLASMPVAEQSAERFLVPQIAITIQLASPNLVLGVALICMLASFTSYNGALLSLSRFIYSLAKQGLLSHRLAILEPRSLTPRPALTALLVVNIAVVAIIYAADLYLSAIYSAATSATFLYATMIGLRERAPFLDDQRGWLLRGIGLVLCISLFGLAAGVLLHGGSQQSNVNLILAVLFSLAAWVAYKARTLRPA